MLTSVRRAPRRKLLVIIALVLSLVLHLIVGVPITLDMTWQEILNTLREKITQLIHPETPDQVLARKKAKSVPKVSINLGPESASQAKKAADVITIRLIQDQPVVIPPKPKAQKNPDAAKSFESSAKKVTSKPVVKPDYDLYDKLIAAPAKAPSEPVSLDDSEDAEQTYDLQKNTLIDNTTVHVVPSSVPAPPANMGQAIAALAASGSINTTATKQSTPSDAPPSFPVEIQANYKTTAFGFSININREWRMEGRRYSIVDKASAFGFKVHAISEGGISEQGLKPDRFQVLLNNNVNRIANFNYNTNILSYGKPNNLKQLPFNSNIQDISSLAFQMALAYDDKPQDIQLTAATGIYNMHLALVNEELLKLPVGKVRTLHIHGTSTSGSPVTADVWLAPDYRNMPVKVKVSRGSDSLEQSLSSLAIEGTVIFGKKRQLEIDSAKNDAENKTSAELPDAIRNKEEF